jgi:ubiquinone/menaquinone biosynthesis C-methylase UbiE
VVISPLSLFRRPAMSNESAWRDREIVREYSQAADLQPPEQAMLNLLADDMRQMRMLDIGVGAGRTTFHFAHMVRSYIGIDYSAEMIAACRARFQRSLEKASFAVLDARALTLFPDDCFDLILFSYNGIDYMSHSDRLRVLKEIGRVGTPGGYFCFSSHNLQDLRQFEFPRLSGSNIRALRKSLSEWLTLRLYYNRIFTLEKLKHRAHALVNDGVHGGRLQTYYIRPEEQLKQLNPYFKDIQLYGLAGNRLGDCELTDIDDPWVYYFCVIR